MATARTTRVLLYAEPSPPGDDLHHLLTQAGYSVTRRPLDPAQADARDAHLIVVEGSDGGRRALQMCRHLRARMAESFVPILFVLDDPNPAWRLASMEAGADTYLLRPFAPGELFAQVDAFLRLKELHDRLGEKTAEVRQINQRLQQTYQQIDAELELARRIQRSFLPRTLPDMPPLRFAVHYRPCGRVGGDFYDVFRLDEDHVGFYVADAMGHGMPASLLTIYVKKGVRAKEIFGSQYRLVLPDEVLYRLNQDMLEQALSESPFITMIYGLFNRRTGTLTLARAGHPYPVHVPRGGAVVTWQLPGSLLGVFDTRFPAQSWQLQPGDRLVLYSDGLVPQPPEGETPTFAPVLAAAARHRELPLADYLVRLASDCEGPEGFKDDVTILAMEIDPAGRP